MGDRQPKAPFPQPTDALADDGTAGFHSSRSDGSARPPAIPATPVTTRPLLIPDDGTEATPPGPEAKEGPLSRDR
jgi:hypothetical protein